MVGGGDEFGALLAFLAFLGIVGFQGYLLWRPAADFFGFAQRSQAPAIEEMRPESEGVVPVLISPLGLVQQQEAKPTSEEQLLLPDRLPTNSPIRPTATPLLPPLPSATPIPAVDFSAVPLSLARFSNYWPPYGGQNCDADCEHLADGSSWRELYAQGLRIAACPAQFPFGTLIEFPPGSGQVWNCLDHGGSITMAADGSWFWLDFLDPVAFVDYGSWIWVKVHVPN